MSKPMKISAQNLPSMKPSASSIESIGAAASNAESISVPGAETMKIPLQVTHAVRDSCFCLHVQRAARVLARRYDDALRPLGLTHGQFSLLMSLNRPEPPTVGQVSRVLAMDRTTLTANLKPLERRSLITVTMDPADKRSKRLELTPAGSNLLFTALPLWKEAQAETARALQESLDPALSAGRAEATLSAGRTARLLLDLRSLSAPTEQGSTPPVAGVS